ncbi:unnamed protein product [Sphagnum troendelagicum]|uniref:Uncharacterized protein n=1 Tax=Sphagnum troendelagicum TaxID=128251 RepID=A0ABP0TYJ1_9BRYO
MLSVSCKLPPAAQVCSLEEAGRVIAPDKPPAATSHLQSRLESHFDQVFVAASGGLSSVENSRQLPDYSNIEIYPLKLGKLRRAL